MVAGLCALRRLFASQSSVELVGRHGTKSIKETKNVDYWGVISVCILQ